jgi:hypothetical protein
MKENRLIAEFMGMTTSENDKSMMIFKTPNGNDIIYLDKLEYHSSWDWLMPVLNKCLNIYHIEQMNDDLNFTFYDAMGNMERTYQAVVEFIKEFNKN